MTLTTRTELRRCGKGKRYATETEALNSKIGRAEGNQVIACTGCGGWHVRMSEGHRQALTKARRSRPPRSPEWYALEAEKRFAKATREGLVPEARPDLGPCLLYTGATNSSGYGQFRYNQRNGYAHRYAWERVNGAIPDGLTIDHLCRVRTCVRLGHLEVVGRVENFLRAIDQKDCCDKGHPYEGNVRLRPGIHRDRRRCVTCDDETRSRSGAKRRKGPRECVYDQDQITKAIARIRHGEISINQAAREIGCNGNYLGRRTWQATKRDVFVRDKGLCVACGQAAMDVQHRIARGSGGTRDPLIAYGMANLVSLCRRCHDVCEARDPHMHAAGYWLNSWQDPAAEGVMYASEHGSGITFWLEADGGLTQDAPEGAGAA